jgi:hypothetical protein
MHLSAFASDYFVSQALFRLKLREEVVTAVLMDAESLSLVASYLSMLYFSARDTEIACPHQLLGILEGLW